MLRAQQQHLVNSLHGTLLGIFTSSPVTDNVPVSQACTAVVHDVNGNPFTLSGVRHRAEFPQLFLTKKTFYFPVFCLLGVKVPWRPSSVFVLQAFSVGPGTQKGLRRTPGWGGGSGSLSSSVCHLNLDLEMGRHRNCGDGSYSKLTRIAAYAMASVFISEITLD